MTALHVVDWLVILGYFAIVFGIAWWAYLKEKQSQTTTEYFLAGRNLGWWVKKNVGQKEIILWEGYCYVHQRFTVEDIESARKIYPDAVVFVHPECRREVLEKADYVLSTSGMLKEAARLESKKYIIGTEEGLLYRLQKDNPEKEFYSLGR